MTVTILETILAHDGTDYRVTLTDGTPHVFHAAIEPEDPQVFCDNAETAMLAALESPWEIEDEGGVTHG